ncbi:SPOSA6832_00140 [Sporobolomyces salmonicolor]|uniref:SPOSA6832_00140-mRNA-1:cds n=1 Tax=Sporidiobolus salmonicolor TaxID=5005 RepID=A0A0D6EFP5_SPOSA|nr:SPOSA6832_00140 [Sporobolomyces salmonicolor]
MEFASGSTLVFPQAVDSLQADRGVIRSQLRDTYNRLHSIAADADFVEDDVARAYPDFPVIVTDYSPFIGPANQRAGAWYVKPSDDHAHAYFKTPDLMNCTDRSTDGHTNEHHFNLRRANLALLPLVKERKGIVLVDSTRRGKRFPDALSKTIPLWCATLNRARMHLLPPASDNSSVSVEEWDRQGQLFTSPQAVGPSEHAQIAAKIEAWAKDLATSSYDLTALKALDRPLRPFFVSPASTLTYSPASAFTSCYPIICASASKLAEEADGMERTRGFTYVQGSGDDHEAWSKGLTPRVFWEHADEILSASREDIDAVIARILDDSSLSASLATTSLSPTVFTQIRATKIHLRFAADPSTDIPADISHITITVSKTAAVSVEMPTPKDLVARPGKAGYATFFAAIEPSLELATKAIKEGRGVAVTVARCESQSEANDLGVAVALILLVSKDFIRTRLQWILEAFPTVNPSRAVLNRVNEYIMPGRRGNV